MPRRFALPADCRLRELGGRENPVGDDHYTIERVFAFIPVGCSYVLIIDLITLISQILSSKVKTWLK